MPINFLRNPVTNNIMQSLKYYKMNVNLLNSYIQKKINLHEMLYEELYVLILNNYL